jgi:hypothetical protein
LHLKFRLQLKISILWRISTKNHTKFVLQVFGVNIKGMQNVTITVEESALEWAEIEAIRRKCSVSILLGQLLKEKMLKEAAEKQPYPYVTPTK